jgi:3-oxoacyl-[acyl-carrier protein] reductase
VTGQRRFTDQRILVCGGATGIGAEAARLLAGEGAEVVVQYRTRQTQARALCEELRQAGSRASLVTADLTVEEEVRAALDDLGHLDGFVHSVSAPLAIEPLEKSSWATYQSAWDASVKSAYVLVRAMLERATPPRAGVFVSSLVTHGAPPKDWSSYVTAKYALLGFVKSIAQDAAGRGLRLNLVSPGMTETPLTAQIEPRRRELIGRSTPLKRLGTVADVASAIAFLLSGESAYVVGTDLALAGGAVL